MKIPKIKKNLLCGTVLFLSLACSEHQNKESSSLPALPNSWFKPTGNSPETLDKPSPETEIAIGEVFKAHTEALDEVSGPMDAQVSAASGHQADWTPWHMDGMIADFALDVGGVFGSLMLDGTATVTGTWQQKKPATARSPMPAKAKKANALRFHGGMTEVEVDQMLEPVVQAAVATKSVHDETAFRKNLNNEAFRFLAVCRALENMIPMPGWHVDSFQLQLTFTGQGNVTPAVGAGGVLNVYFDWKKDAKAPVTAPVSPEVLNSPLYQSLSTFVRTVATLVPQAKEEAAELKGSGFDMDQIQIGIAFLANGTVGVAQLGSTVQGKLIFNSDGSAAASRMLASAEGSASIAMVNASAQLLEAPVVPNSSNQDEPNLIKIPLKKFKKGLIHALNMGVYLAKKAKEADTKKWNVTQIQTEFDAMASGQFHLTTLGAQGQMLLIFDRADAQ